ncbi:hypothetical protein GGF41_007783, partial [Coemansia sp. RSA 2531]
ETMAELGVLKSIDQRLKAIEESEWFQFMQLQAQHQFPQAQERVSGLLISSKPDDRQKAQPSQVKAAEGL